MTGRQFIMKLLESDVDLDREIVFSHDSYSEMIISGEKTQDNWYGVDAVYEWKHPDEHYIYARILLK